MTLLGQRGRVWLSVEFSLRQPALWGLRWLRKDPRALPGRLSRKCMINVKQDTEGWRVNIQVKMLMKVLERLLWRDQGILLGKSPPSWGPMPGSREEAPEWRRGPRGRLHLRGQGLDLQDRGAPGPGRVMAPCWERVDRAPGVDLQRE